MTDCTVLGYETPVISHIIAGREFSEEQHACYLCYMIVTNLTKGVIKKKVMHKF